MVLALLAAVLYVATILALCPLAPDHPQGTLQGGAAFVGAVLVFAIVATWVPS